MTITLKKIIFAFVLLIVLIAVIGFSDYFDKLFKPSEQLKKWNIVAMVNSDTQLPTIEGIKAGLQELGYQEGVHYSIDVKNPKGVRDAVPPMAAEIVNSRPDLIIAVSTTVTTAIRDANKDAKLKVVFANVGNYERLEIKDPQKPGFMSGLATDNVGTAPKRIQFLKSAIPDAKSFAVILDPKSLSYEGLRNSHKKASEALGIEIKEYLATNKSEVEQALAAMEKDKQDGFLVVPETVNSDNTQLIIDTLKKAKIPTLSYNIEKGARIGYLFTYGLSEFSIGKEAVYFVDKVMKGTNPGDLPVAFARNLVLEINAKTAADIGFKIPDVILRQANKIYE